MSIDYKTDVSIDESALDVEWLQQPELMMKYTRLEAKGERAYEKAKSNLDIVEAELDQQIRENPQDYGIPKVTNKAVESVILTNEDYKAAKSAVNEARFRWKMAQGAVKALYGKKDALENLVRLHGQQYFAGPKTPRNLSKEWEDRIKQEQSDKKVNIKKQKRTRKK